MPLRIRIQSIQNSDGLCCRMGFDHAGVTVSGPGFQNNAFMGLIGR